MTHLDDRLRERRAAIVNRWKALALHVYPERAASFISGERDRFQNPVGHVMAESLGILYDSLLAGAPAGQMRQALDGIIRIRAVQDLSPSAAVGFVFLLKQAISDELQGSDAGSSDMAGLAGLHQRIDRIALETFDIYMQCREQIYDLRLREIRNRVPAPPDGPQARQAEESEGARD